MKSCPFCAEDIQEAAIVCRHCRKDLTERRSLSGTVAVAIFVLVLAAGAWVAVTQRTPSSPPEVGRHQRVTWAKFLQLGKGQSKADAIRLLGEPDSTMEGDLGPGAHQVLYEWRNGDGSHIIATFLNDALTYKTQSKLN